ncbi:transketolase [Bacteroidota bacterium]
MEKTIKLEQIASQIRRDIIRMINNVESGHPGGSLGCADILTALYFDIMEINPAEFKMSGENEDMFFLSNGHISPLFYSVLGRRGYFDINEFSTFRKLNTRLQGHPATEEGLPGIRVASGSLGQGISVAVGNALAKKLNKDPHLTFVLTGDGELQEGQNWEALMFAAHHKVDNIILTIDHNKKQIDGPTDEVISLLDLGAKLNAFGWEVIGMDGNNMEDILATYKRAVKQTKNHKPIAILARTVMGKGVDFMENKHQWHGVAPNDDECKLALSQLDETIGDFKID